MKFLVFGSVNIDCVYQVPHIVAPGETIMVSKRSLHSGGKGANQAAALARAGAQVYMAGRVGLDGQGVISELQSCGADTSLVAVDPASATGHGLIQLAADGENAICIFPGANAEITPEQIIDVMEKFHKGDVLLIQNEINNLAMIIQAAAGRGMYIVFNPAPFTREVMLLPIEMIDLFIVNQVEAAQLSKLPASTGPDDLLDELAKKLPKAEIVLTLGKEGAAFSGENGRFFAPAENVKPVDTTGAGDTFIGFFLYKFCEGSKPLAALQYGCKAAGIAVTRLGAMGSIPQKEEL